MDEQHFVIFLKELMDRIEDGPTSHVSVLSQIAKRHTANNELDAAIDELKESVDCMRLIIKYLLFDLEATRRERDQLRSILEDHND